MKKAIMLAAAISLIGLLVGPSHIFAEAGSQFMKKQTTKMKSQSNYSRGKANEGAPMMRNRPEGAPQGTMNEGAPLMGATAEGAPQGTMNQAAPAIRATAEGAPMMKNRPEGAPQGTMNQAVPAMGR